MACCCLWKRRAKKKARAAGWDEEAYQQHIAQEGNSIALSKLDRGFDTDFDDIIFLIQQNLVSLNELERITRDALPHAREYDFHLDILDHLKELKNRIG